MANDATLPNMRRDTEHFPLPIINFVLSVNFP